MALSKTWYTDTDIALTDNSREGLVWMLKSALIGETTGTPGATGAAPGPSLLSVKGSSDAVTAGMDNTDRLLAAFDASKIVFSAAGAMSWIVVGNTDLQLLIGCKHAANTAVDFRMSKVGFSGGSTTAYPTASDSVAIDNVAYHDGSASNYNIHIARDADGYFSLVYGKVSTNFIWGWLGVCLLEDTDPADTHPQVLLQEYITTTPGAGSLATVVMAARNVSNTTSYSGSGSCEPMGIATLQSSNPASVTAPLLSDGSVGLFDFYVWLPGASPQQIKGRVPDMHQSFKQKAPGDTRPTTGDIEQVQLARVVIPLSGTPTL